MQAADSPPATQPAGIDGAWSDAKTDTTPSGVPFHGPFTNQYVSAKWDRLPPHDFVRVTVDLMILRTWDGSIEVPLEGRLSPNGPDYFRLEVAGGPILLWTTFSNYPADDPFFFEECKSQNFPSPVPGDTFSPQTGAAEKNTLGYNWPVPGPPKLVPMDAVYRLTFLIPNKEASLTLNLEAFGLQNILDESWGVRSITARPLLAKDLPMPSDEDIAKAFDRALDNSVSDQPEAVNTLISGMDKTTAWLAKNVSPSTVADKDVLPLIADLAGGDDHITERQAAAKSLCEMGPVTEPLLRDARRQSRGEPLARIERVLHRTGVTNCEEPTRRMLLATRVLEVIDTPAAQKVHSQLASVAGAAASPATQPANR